VETFNTYDQNALYRLTYRKTVGPGTGHLFTPLQQSMLAPLVAETAAGPDFSQSSPTNPLEVTTARSATTKTYFLGSTNGKLNYETQFHSAPQYTADASGNLMPLDSFTQIITGTNAVNVEQAGYSTQVQKTPTTSLFGYSESAGTINVAFADAKASNKSPTESTANNKTVFTYTNALGSGENLELISTDTYLQKNIVLTKAPAHTGTNPNYTVTFKLSAATGAGILDARINGQLLSAAGTITTSDAATIFNNAGVVAYIWPPSARDATPQIPGHQIPISLIYVLKSDGIYVTKQIPFNWLATAAYPVRADLTFSNYANGGDGGIGTQPYPSSWSTQHSDTTGQNAGTGGLNIQVSSEAFDSSTGYLGIGRGFIPIDTSGLPDNAVVSSSTLYTFVTGNQNDFNDAYSNINIYQGFEASPTGLVNSDVSKCGNALTNPTKGSTDLPIASTTVGSYAAFPLTTAGKSWISATSTTKFCVREGHDASNNEPVNNGDFWKYELVYLASSVNSGTAEDPYIDIQYSLSDTVPATSTQLRAEDQTNPINVTNTQPRFSAQYNDVDVGDTAVSYELELATSSSGFGSPLWDSGKLALSPSVTAGNQSQDISYAGPPLALDHTAYYWRIKFWDLANNASTWSSGTDTFTMADDGTHIQSLHYTYDPVGNITSILDDVNGSEQNIYTYDPLNRLTTASSTLSGSQTSYLKNYAYDPLGNITSSTDLGTYAYQGNIGTNYANPDAPTSIGNGLATTTLGYDANGNLLSDGTYNYAWDYLNELTQVGKGGATSTYAYDYAGNRVKVTDTTGTTYYPNKYYSFTPANGSVGTTTVKNIYASGVLVTTINSNAAASAATSTPALNAVSANFTTSTTGTTTTSWTHTTSFGTNRLLVLTASILQGIAGTGSISSASYAGLPLTKVSSSRTGTIASELWYLFAPPSGTKTLTVNTVGSTSAMKFSLSDYTGVSQTSLDATSSATGTTGNPSTAVTTHLAGDLVLSTLSRTSNTPATTNRTLLFNDVSSTTLAAASYQVSGSAGSISDTYTGTATQPWAMSIAAFAPATTTPTTGTTTSTYYIHPDHLGGANALTDSAGLLNENLQYYPYGALRTDTLAGTYGGTKRKYIGQVYDGSTGLNYLNARYQNPVRGQFLSEDPVFWGNPLQQNITDPQSFNSYSYAGDNPISRKDPTGLAFGIDDAAGFVAGGLVGVGAQYISNSLAGQQTTPGQFAGAFLTGGVIGWGAINTPETLGASNAVSASIVTGLIGGFYGSVAQQAIDKRKLGSVDVNQAGINGLYTAGTNGAFQALVPSAQIAGLSKGSNSYNAIGASVRTKTTNGTIGNISVSTAAKSAVGSQASDLYRTLSSLLADLSRTLSSYTISQSNNGSNTKK